MNIFSALYTGLIRSIKAWKSLLFIWFFYLLMAVLIASPMKSAFSSGIGNSMITGMFAGDLNIEFLTDMGDSFRSVMSFFRTGLLLMLLISIPVNAFFAGGLFRILGMDVHSLTDFWEGATVTFWSFLVISLIMSLIILVSFIIIVILPVSFMISGETLSDASMFKAGILLFVVFLMWLAILLLVTDFARSWQSSSSGNRRFAAVGYGFRQAFRSFLKGWPMMLLLMIVQALFIYLVTGALRGMAPVTSIGVFLLFIASQLLFLIRIFLRSLRYASVIALR